MMILMYVKQACRHQSLFFSVYNIKPQQAHRMLLSHHTKPGHTSAELVVLLWISLDMCLTSSVAIQWRCLCCSFDDGMMVQNRMSCFGQYSNNEGKNFAVSASPDSCGSQWQPHNHVIISLGANQSAGSHWCASGKNQVWREIVQDLYHYSWHFLDFWLALVSSIYYIFM